MPGGRALQEPVELLALAGVQRADLGGGDRALRLAELQRPGLEPRFITAELTLAAVTPAMADLIPLMEESIAAAERAVDDQWPVAVPTAAA